MTAYGFVQIALYCVVVTLLVKPFGFYITRVFNGERTFLSPLLRPIAVVVGPGLAGLANSGPHGFSEALYAYVSTTANNGSAFAGLSANTRFWNTTLGLAMWIGRFLFIVPMLAIAGFVSAFGFLIWV